MNNKINNLGAQLYQLIIDNILDIPISIRDLESKFIWVSQLMSTLLGFNSMELAIGKHISEVPNREIAKQAATIELMDKEVFCHIKEQSSIWLSNTSENFQIWVFNKKCLIDPISKKVYGLISIGSKVDFLWLFECLLFEQKNLKFTPSERLHRTKLTSYEQNICYLLLLGLSTTQIANFLNFYNPLVNGKLRNKDAIDKAKKHICEKLQIKTNYLIDLKAHLIKLEFHHRLPDLFVDLLLKYLNKDLFIGSKKIIHTI